MKNAGEMKIWEMLIAQIIIKSWRVALQKVFFIAAAILGTYFPHLPIMSDSGQRLSHEIVDENQLVRFRAFFNPSPKHLKRSLLKIFRHHRGFVQKFEHGSTVLELQFTAAVTSEIEEMIQQIPGVTAVSMRAQDCFKYEYTAFARLETANRSIPDETGPLPLSEANIRELNEPSSGDTFERKESFETSTTSSAMSAVQESIIETLRAQAENLQSLKLEPVFKYLGRVNINRPAVNSIRISYEGFRHDALEEPKAFVIDLAAENLAHASAKEITQFLISNTKFMRTTEFYDPRIHYAYRNRLNNVVCFHPEDGGDYILEKMRYR